MDGDPRGNGGPAGDGAAPGSSETGGSDLMNRLEEIGQLELETGEETIFEGEAAKGAEHLRAAEGIMTFPGDEAEADPWMEQKLDAIGKKHNTGLHRGKGRRRGRVFGRSASR